jgi:hypothetical protein
MYPILADANTVSIRYGFFLFLKGTARVLSQFLLEGERNKIQKKLNKKGGLKLPTTPTTRAYGRKQL